MSTLVTHFGIEGLFRVELIRRGRIVRALEFQNLITDAGLNAIGNGTTLDSLVQYLGVGTDNTSPAVSQTALGAQVGGRTNSNGGFADVVTSGASYSYWQLARTRLFLEAEANGNLTELGMFSAATAGTMWCRQLFLDDLGNPTTLVKTSEEQLRVTYSWRIYPNQSQVEDVLTIDSVETSCLSRAMDIDGTYWNASGFLKLLGAWTPFNQNMRAYETNTFPAITAGDFTGTPAEASSRTVQAYSNGNFYKDIDIVWEPAVANFATGIGAVAFGPCASFTRGLGTTFTPKVQKINTQRFTFRARIAWGRR